MDEEDIYKGTTMRTIHFSNVVYGYRSIFYSFIFYIKIAYSIAFYFESLFSTTS